MCRRCAYNGGYLFGYSNGGGGRWVLSDVEAIGGNWLYLNNMIVLSSSACGKQDNQKKTENIPEFLVDMHNSSNWHMDCSSTYMNLRLSVAHELHKRVRTLHWVVLYGMVLVAAG
jgi:hypothetical protein